MAGDEYEAQQVVADLVIGPGLDLRPGGALLHLKLVRERLVLARQHAVAPQLIQGAIPCCHHEPGSGVVGNARVRPLLESGDQRILGEFFRQPHVADHPCQACDEPCGLDPPHGLDGAMGIRDLHGHG